MTCRACRESSKLETFDDDKRKHKRERGCVAHVHIELPSRVLTAATVATACGGGGGEYSVELYRSLGV